MQIARLILDTLLHREIAPLNLLPGKGIDEYSWAELVNIHEFTLPIVAEILSEEYCASVSDFESKFTPDLRMKTEEDETEFAQRVSALADERVLPVLHDGVMKVLCWNPFSPALDNGMLDLPLIIAPAKVIDHLYSGSHSADAEVAPWIDGERTESWISRLIHDCHTRGASDIEVTSMSTCMRVRIHARGSWTDWIGTLPILQRGNFLRALCAMSIPSMDYEQGAVHDFKIELRIRGTDTSWRVAIAPAALGDTVTMRLLPQIGKIPELHTLGFCPQAMGLLRRASAHKDGLLLITGATGSGKTTSLYSIIDELRQSQKKVYTVEQPVELIIPGTVQMEERSHDAIEDRFKLTFAGGIRAALRHKPDVLVVGETRDTETAQTAVSASRTGHLTWTTLHTGSVRTSVKRLIDLGIDKTNLADTLRLVVSQRLVLRLCGFCKLEQADGTALRNPEGCPHCKNTGYSSDRIVVAEIAYLDEEARESIVDDALRQQFPRLEAKGLYISMRESVLRLVRQGVIDPSEAIDV